MSVPYRKAPKAANAPTAAYVDIIWLRPTRTFYGAILIIDDKGQPLEFVYNTLVAPAGFLWPEDQVRVLGVAALCHSLFDACEREPDLLVCKSSLGSPHFCKSEIAPMTPFAQVADSSDGAPAEWGWINNPPSPAMAAHSLGDSLRAHGFAEEPFDRILFGLREIYPEAPWSTVVDDPD